MTIMALLFSANSGHEIDIIKDIQNLAPTVDLSAIRPIFCHDPKHPAAAMGWIGSGSLIAHNTVLTAYHVASGVHCVDNETGKPLKMYKYDKDHDIALMGGEQPDIPYIKYSCQGYKPKETYSAYGITGFMSDHTLFRQVSVTAVGKNSIEYDIDDTGDTAGKDMTEFEGATVPGMSGGPYINTYGYQLGIVNAGEEDPLGIPTGRSFSYELKDTFLCK